jgi:hypothetical protein
MCAQTAPSVLVVFDFNGVAVEMHNGDYAAMRTSERSGHGFLNGDSAPCLAHQVDIIRKRKVRHHRYWEALSLTAAALTWVNTLINDYTIVGCK